jgi:hypothetical protein
LTDDSGKLVYLAFRNDKLLEDELVMFACKVCRNKTYKVINDGQDDYPLLRCAACDSLIGRIGWASQ